MSDTLTKTDELGYFQEDWKIKKKFNQILTKNQALSICNSLYLYCKDDEDLIKEIGELKNYIRNK